MIDYKKVKVPSDKYILQYNNLKNGKENVSYAVAKLNGGLSTTLGKNYPKGSLKVKDNMSFIEIFLRQTNYISKNTPIIFMNSFFTYKQTLEEVKRININNKVYMFNQKQQSKKVTNTDKDFYINNVLQKAPTGHGDFYESINSSGIIEKLLEDNIDYLLVSNIDNLAAIPDLNILNYMKKNNVDFVLETTNKTHKDLKGGTPILYDSKLRMLEKAIVPKELEEKFASDKYFKVFNTNNVWIDVKKLYYLYNNKKIILPKIRNNKIINKTNIYYEETIIGDGINLFENPKIINVSRDRFDPTKTLDDLLKKQSDYYMLTKNFLLKTV